MRVVRKAWFAGLALATCVTGLVQAQDAKQPLAFETASVKPAPPGAQSENMYFMMPMYQGAAPRGLMAITAPVHAFIFFSEGLDSFTEYQILAGSLPGWAKMQLYTITVRIDGNPTRDQLREMVHTMLVERFALKDHMETHDGAVERLTLIRPGTTGPQMKPHGGGAGCGATDQLHLMQPPEAGKPAVCGMNMYRSDDGLLHFTFTNVTVAQACKMLGGAGSAAGGRGFATVLDGSGLSGMWDMTLVFHPEMAGTGPGVSANADTGGPTFTGALEKQLGMKLVKGTGPIRTLLVDHIAEPTAN